MKATIGDKQIECVDSFIVGVEYMNDVVNTIIDEIIMNNNSNSTAIRCAMDIRKCVAIIKNDITTKCNY